MATLNEPQCDFLDLEQKFRLFVAGFGSGKTWVGCAGICEHAWKYPRIDAGYFAPTYAQIRDIFYPTIEEVAEDYDLRAVVRPSHKEVDLFSGKNRRITIKCRSIDKPDTIVGFKIGHALVDELDLLPMNKARQAWRKIIARMRYKRAGLRNGIDVTTTPEGFKFVYDQFVKQVREKPELAKLYGMVQASTFDNELNLPDDYISSLLASYPPQLIQAYLRGEFTNLTSGSVYPDFDRKLNHTPEKMADGEALHIGMDFNVLNMTGIVSVIRNDQPFSVDEITGVRDTPAMVTLIKERYQGQAITIYPDASGQNTSSKNASESDLSILRNAGFTVRANTTNPAIKDRVLSVNAMILNAEGKRRWMINTDACPKLTEGLEKQAYDDNGSPDKKTGFDHVNDAAGYFITARWPVVKNVAILTRTRGL